MALSGLGIYLGGNSPNQCDPSDPDRDLACCWLKQIVTYFPDCNFVFLFQSIMLVSSGGMLGMVTSRQGV